jgi:hypothetical protein
MLQGMVVPPPVGVGIQTILIGCGPDRRRFSAISMEWAAFQNGTSNRFAMILRYSMRTMLLSIIFPIEAGFGCFVFSGIEPVLDS